MGSRCGIIKLGNNLEKVEKGSDILKDGRAGGDYRAGWLQLSAST